VKLALRLLLIPVRFSGLAANTIKPHLSSGLCEETGGGVAGLPARLASGESEKPCQTSSLQVWAQVQRGSVSWLLRELQALLSHCLRLAEIMPLQPATTASLSMAELTAQGKPCHCPWDPRCEKHDMLPAVRGSKATDPLPRAFKAPQRSKCSSRYQFTMRFRQRHARWWFNSGQEDASGSFTNSDLWDTPRKAVALPSSLLNCVAALLHGLIMPSPILLEASRHSARPDR